MAISLPSNVTVPASQPLRYHLAQVTSAVAEGKPKISEWILSRETEGSPSIMNVGVD